MTIVLRSTKGTALTYGEVDGNFSDLDARTVVKWAEVIGTIETTGITNAPTIVNYAGVAQLPQFSPDVVQECTVTYHIPKNYVAGTDIYPHYHMVTDTASTGTLRMGLTYIWANEYDAHDQALGPPSGNQFFSAPVTVYHELAITSAMQNAALNLDGVAATLTGLSQDAILLCRLFRDATHVNDTYPDGVFLMFADVYYQAQKFGSTNR